MSRTRGAAPARNGGRRILLALTALALVMASAGPASAQEYTFTKVADSVEDEFDPFSFGCSAINARGAVAFRAGRRHPDGFNTIPGIYRVSRNGTFRTIAENERRFVTIGFNPSMNDLGDVSFAARLEGRSRPDTEAILRGRGRSLTVIASTADRFNFFGFDTSINNSGEVAFKAELDEEFGFEEGLFSGTGGDITTHYTASTSRFDGNDSRPSINDLGDIAFDESVDFESGIFVTQGDGFETIAPPDPDRSVGEPVLNNAGTAAFALSFFDEENEEFVESIVTGDGGPLTTVVDTRGPLAFFGFRPPSLNDRGEVAYIATLDDYSTTGIFVGPDPEADRVIATGDTLDGSTIQNLTFCEEGLNDSGELAFTAALEEPNSEEGFRMAVFRASPSS